MGDGWSTVMGDGLKYIEDGLEYMGEIGELWSTWEGVEVPQCTK